jgi:chromosome segregation ATPase
MEPLGKSNEALRQNVQQLNRMLQSKQEVEQRHKDDVAKLKESLAAAGTHEQELHEERDKTATLQNELAVLRTEISHRQEAAGATEVDIASLKEQLSAQNMSGTSQLREAEQRHERVVRDLTNTLAAKEREVEALRADGDSSKRRWQIVKAKKHPY